MAEIERLEQLNAEFSNIAGIDDLFIHHGRSDSDLLDEMLAEFGLEFPNFDIFNYVDPALDTAFDSGAAELLDIIDSEIRQPDINLNSLDIQKKLFAKQGEELQSLKSELQKQQELISELQQQFNNFIVKQQSNPMEDQPAVSLEFI